MKKKELNSLAKKIAKAELVIQTSSDPAEIERAQNDIMTLTSKVESLSDVVALDELVYDILSKKFDN